MYCGKCGAEINDNLTFCTECGAKTDISADNTTNEEITAIAEAENKRNEGIYKLANQELSTATHIEQLEYAIGHFQSIIDYKDSKDKILQCQNKIIEIKTSEAQKINAQNQAKFKIGITVACVAFAVIITTALLFYKHTSENQLALDMYQAAYSSLYDTDVTFISNKTQKLIDDAMLQAESSFVSNDTRQKISKLSEIGENYALLGEIENLFATDKTQFNLIKSYFERITNDDVKRDERYTKIVPYVQALEFKEENRQWAWEVLNSFDTENADTINSWSKNHSINFYTGLAYFKVYDEGFLDIILEDYYGNAHELYFECDNESWGESIGRLAADLSSGKVCVMAAAATEEGKIFLYNRKLSDSAIFPAAN